MPNLSSLFLKLLTLAIIDIDHFKRINDTGGHDAGDEALKHVSLILKEHIGDDGLLARVGGEEFAIVYIDTDEVPPISRADTLLAKLENSPFCYAEQKYKITVSIGLCIFSGQHNLDQIIKQADDALYSAKRRGRNRQEIRKIA